ncbi:MAG TPA: PAS domain S-box protein [Chitinophagaceae bacterium]
MQLLPDLPLQIKLVRWSRYLIAIVVTIAFLVLLGWQQDIKELKQPPPSLSPMNPLNAVLFILWSASFLLITSGNPSRRKKILAYVFAAVVSVTGLYKIVSLFIDLGWQPDLVLFRDVMKNDIRGINSNSMAPSTAFCFMLAGIGLFFLQIHSSRNRAPVQYFALIIALAGWLSILGHLYSIKEKDVPVMLAYVPMAFNTAVCFLSGALSLLFAQPGKGIMKQFTSNYSGSHTARLIVPAAVLVPTVIGLIRLQGYTNTELGVALYSLIIIFIFLGLAWYIAFILNKRDQQLKSFNEELSLQVDEKTKEISIARDLSDKLIDSLPGIFYFFDESGKFIRWNKQLETVTGYTAEEIAGRHPLDFFEGENKTYIREKIEEVFVKGVSDSEAELVTKTGDLIFYSYRAVLVNYEGKPCLLGTGVDITEQKEAERQLRISEQKYKLLFFSNPRPMFMLSLPDYKLIEVNSSAVMQYGYTREEFLQLSAFDLRPEEDHDKFKARIAKGLQGIQHAGIWRHKKKDGTIIYVDVTTHDIFYEDRPARLVLADDVTERHAAEEKLKESYDSIRKLTEHLQQVREEERTHIAREIHDELGQQLTVLKMDIAWLNKKIETGDQQVKEKIKDLFSMIDTTVKTVRRIAAELRPSLLDDLGLIPAMEWHLEEFEKRSGIRTGFSKPQTNHQLSDDVKIGLFRIFQESLTNVARHSKAREVNVSLEENDKKVILTIADDGLGFSQENESKRTLGILGMKERTLMLGGEYTITGIRGKGTTVFVSVPLNDTDDNNMK